jgi:hypothetical protein
MEIQGLKPNYTISAIGQHDQKIKLITIPQLNIKISDAEHNLYKAISIIKIMQNDALSHCSWTA